jgi:hypothetical protein
VGVDLIPVKPEDIQEVWPPVVTGLKRIKDRRHTSEGWIPEDVYHALRSGSSVLHLCYVEGEYCGFTVSTLLQQYDGKALHFWIVYNASKVDIIGTFMPDVELIARTAGAKRVTFWSPRRWERRIKRYGFLPTQTEFVKELL